MLGHLWQLRSYCQLPLHYMSLHSFNLVSHGLRSMQRCYGTFPLWVLCRCRSFFADCEYCWTSLRQTKKRGSREITRNHRTLYTTFDCPLKKKTHLYNVLVAKASYEKLKRMWQGSVEGSRTHGRAKGIEWNRVEYKIESTVYGSRESAAWYTE